MNRLVFVISLMCVFGFLSGFENNTLTLVKALVGAGVCSAVCYLSYKREVRKR